MADEIAITVSGSLSNAPAGESALYRTYSHGTAQITQATKRRAGETQALTNTWEAIDIGDVTDGYVFLLNLHATNSVELGTLEAGSGGSTVKFAVLDPGDPPALVHIESGVNLYARAKDTGSGSETADLDVEIWSA